MRIDLEELEMLKVKELDDFTDCPHAWCREKLIVENGDLVCPECGLFDLE